MLVATLKFRAVLFGLAQVFAYKARRYPAFRARLHERNLIAQIKARDEEIGRWFAIRDGKITSGPGVHPKADVVLAFKNAELGASLLMPPINWLDQINAQKDFKLTVDGPEDLTNWFAQTIMMSQTVGWRFGTPLAGRGHALLQHDQWRAGFRLCQGRQDRAHDADRFRQQRSAAVDDRSARIEAHAAAQDDARAARPECEVDRLFARSAAVSDEARRFRSEGRTQPAEPRQIGLCAHFLGGGARSRRRRNQAHEARRTVPARWRHRTVRIIPGAISAITSRRCSASAMRSGFTRDPPQSRQLGRLVLGRGASLGLYAARRAVGDLRHRRGLPAELRHDRVLGGRSRDHQRFLRRAGRHSAPAMAEESKTRHQGRSRRPVLQRVGAIPAGQVVCAQAHHLGRDGDGDRLRLDQ